MSTRTRTAKSTKILKENVGITSKAKPKSSCKVAKPPRKALADKTNSASDENGSIETPKKATKKHHTVESKKILSSENDNPTKPRRERRPPKRFIEYFAKKSSSNVISFEDNSSLQSPFKTPQKATETSMVTARQRRVSKLPSRFEDNSMSPSKFIPVPPVHASTPISLKGSVVNGESNKKVPQNSPQEIIKTPNKKQQKVACSKLVETKLEATKPDPNNNAKVRTLRSRKNSNAQTALKEVNEATEKQSPDKTPVKLSKSKPETNNTCYKIVTSKPSPVKNSRTKSPLKKSPIERQRLLKNDFSFKILEDNKKNKSNLDVYEFTFDPGEEPAPQKKKKRVQKKKPAKPKQKSVVFKLNYDQNVNKALAALKNVVAKKPKKDNGLHEATVSQSYVPESKDGCTMKQPNAKNLPQMQQNLATDIVIKNSSLKPQPRYTKFSQIQQNTMQQSNTQKSPQIQRNVASKIIIGNSSSNPQTRNNYTMKNVPEIQQNLLIHSPNKHSSIQHQSVNNTTMTGLINAANASKLPEQSKSIRIEDIEADFASEINYSPVNSPERPVTPVAQSSLRYSHDPLNLRENSFFEQNPVASSSMNRSTTMRHPQGSPWRVEFESLPIRWHVNSYVKPNMTPAVECSFVNFNDKRKHVYTNLVPESSDTLPEIVQRDQTDFRQLSMFDFIKQQVEKSSAKKKRERSVTPVQAHLFKTPSKDAEMITNSKKQLFTPKKSENLDDPLLVDDNTSNDKENSKESSRNRKRKNEENLENMPCKNPRKEKDNTYFGFDDSEDIEQENLSPKKMVDGRKRALRPRARAVLKEINNEGPARGAVPVVAKAALNAEVERLYNEMKSASDAPEFHEQVNIGSTNIDKTAEEMSEDSQTVPLFEDMEDIVHHVKVQRKSYGKAKKVTFRQPSSDNSDTQDEAAQVNSENSEAEDDLADLTFDPGVPFQEEVEKKKKKKLTKKQKLTKKEDEEAEAWAAGFNSMCEDVEDFPLLIE